MARKRLPFAQISCATCRLCFCFFGVRPLAAALPFSLLCKSQFGSLRKRGSVEARGFNPAKIRRRRAPSLVPQAALSSAWRTAAVPSALLHPAPPPRIVIPRNVQCTFRGTRSFLAPTGRIAPSQKHGERARLQSRFKKTCKSRPGDPLRFLIL